MWLGEGADLDPDARVDGPVVIGDNCRVEAGAHLAEYTVLGADVVVKPTRRRSCAPCSTTTSTSDRGAALRGAVVGRSSDVREHARLEEGVVIGDECFIGPHAIVSAGVKIYPFKTVDADAVVNSSIIWETQGRPHPVRPAGRPRPGERRRHLRGRGACRDGVRHRAEARLGRHREPRHEPRRPCAEAGDHRRAELRRRHRRGRRARDRAAHPIPGAQQPRPGRASPSGSCGGDPDSVEMRFFDADGRDIDAGTQRSIERLLYREDFRRAFAGDIGEIMFPPRAIEFYTAALERSVDARAAPRRPAKVVLDYSFGAASVVMPTVLGKLGAEVLAVNPYASTAAVTADRARRAAGPDGRARAGVGQPARLHRRAGRGDRDASSTTPATPLSDDEALLAAAHPPRRDARPGARSRCPCRRPGRRARIVEAAGGEVVWTKLDDARAHGGRLRPAASTSRRRAAAGYIWPAFLPAYDAMAHPGPAPRPARRDRPARVRRRRRASRPFTSSTRPCPRRGSARGR